MQFAYNTVILWAIIFQMSWSYHHYQLIALRMTYLTCYCLWYFWSVKNFKLSVRKWCCQNDIKISEPQLFKCYSFKRKTNILHKMHKGVCTLFPLEYLCCSWWLASNLEQKSSINAGRDSLFLHQRTSSNIKGFMTLGLADLRCKGVRGKNNNIQRDVKITEFTALFNEIEPKDVI